jgi:hypothetical protein
MEFGERSAIRLIKDNNGVNCPNLAKLTKGKITMTDLY